MLQVNELIDEDVQLLSTLPPEAHRSSDSGLRWGLPFSRSSYQFSGSATRRHWWLKRQRRCWSLEEKENLSWLKGGPHTRQL